MRLPAVSDSQPLRLLLFFLLYGSQGVTFGLFIYAVPAWIGANGGSAAQIGAVVTATGLPWSIKFLNGFLMDRFTFLPMGRRRAWLMGGQAAATMGLLIVAVLDPLVTDIALISACAFLLNLAINFQDVATDGMAADLVPKEQRARTNGAMFGGQAIGISASTAFGGMLLAEFGMRAAAAACAVYVFLTLLAAAACRERAGERLLPWSVGNASPHSAAVQPEAWGPLFRTVFHAMRQRNSLVLALMALSQGVGWGLGLGAMPLLGTQQAGMDQATYSALSGSASLVAGMMALLVFGVLADLVGPLRFVRVALASAALLILGMLLAQPLWASPWPITLFVFGFLMCRVAVMVCYGALSMGRCVAAVAASHMTIFMSMPNFGATLGNLLIGPVDAIGGHAGLLVVMAGFYSLAVLLAFLLRAEPLPQSEEAIPALAAGS
jgi:PAT family beta-lactamase induction signal transducer AmpG